MAVTFEDAAIRITKLTDFSRKSPIEVMLSYLEELGELCAEIKIYLKIAGTEHKKPGKDGIYGECADVWICAVSLQWANDNRFIDWSPGPNQHPAGPFNDLVAQLIKPPDTSMNEIGWLAVAIAMYMNPSKEAFVQKIHEKLDKWERNVGYLKVPAKPTGTAEAMKNCVDIARAIQMKDNS